jgi:hypothetical protein
MARVKTEMTSRAIPLSAHSVIEIIGAPLLMAAPFVLGFGYTAGAITIALGAMLMGLAISTSTDQRTIPLSAHASFDYALGTLTVVTGLLVGIAGGEPLATAFLVGFGVAHLALTASTRFSARGA